MTNTKKAEDNAAESSTAAPPAKRANTSAKTPAKTNATNPMPKKRPSTASALQNSAEKRASPKQPLMPAKLTLTINFGTKDNPKSRSRTKKPLAVFSPRITSARRHSDTQSMHLNDALIKYDRRSSLHSGPNGSARGRSPLSARRHSTNEVNLNLNHSSDTWSRSARGNGDTPGAMRHHSVDLTHAVPSSYKLAEQLHNTQQSLNKEQRPQSARPSHRVPSSPWQSSLNQQHSQSHGSLPASAPEPPLPQPSAEPDYVNVNYNYSFLKKPVNKMSPRFTRDMSRFKEDYKLLKSRLYGADELLMGVRNTSAFSHRQRPATSGAFRRASAPQPQHNIAPPADQHVDHAPSYDLQDNRHEHSTHQEEGEQQHTDEQTPPQPSQRSPSRTDIARQSHDEYHYDRSPSSPSFSFHMQAFPPPKYFVSSTKPTEDEQRTPKRPKSAASSTRRHSASQRRDSRPASAAATTRRQSTHSGMQYTDESEYHSQHRRSPTPQKTPTDKEPMFGVFPPSRIISNQFFSRQRMAMNTKKNRERRDNQRKLSQLLSTEGFPSPSMNGFVAEQHKTFDQQPVIPQSSISASARVPTLTEREQRDIIAYYDKKKNASQKDATPNGSAPIKDGVDDLPSGVRAQLQKDSAPSPTAESSSPKAYGKNHTARLSQRNVLSPSAVSPVLFHTSSLVNAPLGVTQNSFDGTVSSFSPTSSSGSPHNASFSCRGQESPQLRRSASVAERIKKYDWEGLQIGTSNASSRFLSGTAPLVEQSPTLKRRPKSAAAVAASHGNNEMETPRGGNSGEFSLLSTPSHMFEYRKRASDIESPIQIVKKELTDKVPRPGSAGASRNGTGSSLRQSSLTNGGTRPTSARRPASAVRRSGAAGGAKSAGDKKKSKKAIKIKTPFSAPVNPERLDSPMTVPTPREETGEVEGSVTE